MADFIPALRPQEACMSSVSVYYFSEFLASSAFNSFISLFYRARGMSMGRLSLLMAAAPLTAFLALPLWGTLCDRAGKRNNFLQV